MTTKLIKVAELINEALKYNDPKNDEIMLYEDKVINETGLDTQDVDWCFKKLFNDGIISRRKELNFQSPYMGFKYVDDGDKKNPIFGKVFKDGEGNKKLVTGYAFIFSVNREKLNEILTTAYTDSDNKAEFLDDDAVLKFGKIRIQLPPHKNEHWFCKAAFEYLPNEAVDWEELYEKMTGYYGNFFGKPKTSKENWRKVYDTMEAINRRIESQNLGKLFSWQEKTVRRLR